jgi:hypothetical protein
MFFFSTGLFKTFSKEQVQNLASQYGEVYAVHMLPSNSFPTNLWIVRFKELGSAIKMVDTLDETVSLKFSSPRLGVSVLLYS